MARHQFLVRAALRRGLIVCLLAPIVLLTACSRSLPLSVQKIALDPASLQTIVQGFYDTGKGTDRGRTPTIPVVIVPHHLTAAVTIAAGIAALVPQHPSDILLLSPDHYHACGNLLCTTNTEFETTFGKTLPDADVLKVLRSSPLVSDTPLLFDREHGIRSVIPFIAHYLPGTRVTPLVLAGNESVTSHKEELLVLLNRVISSGTVLVVSSDFSHYLSLLEADRKDTDTSRVLLSNDRDGLLHLQNPSQSDCPLCLWFAANIASARDAFNPSILLHTNSARLLGDTSATSTTSHFAIAFYRNAALSPSDVTFGGDVTLTGSGSSRTQTLPDAVSAFWAGSGSRILNLEGPLAERCTSSPNPFLFCITESFWKRIAMLADNWSVENNHMLDRGASGKRQTIELLRQDGKAPLSDTGTMVGGLQVYALSALLNPVPEEGSEDLFARYRHVIGQLRAGSGSGRAQVAYVHAGTEYQALTDDADDLYLRSFVDAGSSAVFAVHSHVPGDTEFYKGAPIFRGLGNFVFDQYQITATHTAKAVRLRAGKDGMEFQTVIGK